MQTGDVHGYLVVVAPTENRYRREILWLVRCRECGIDLLMRKRQIASAERKVCRHRPIQTHPLFYIWKGMKDRCSRVGHYKFQHYGGRGIKVCKRWHDFWNFVEDMGPRPSKRHSIDRFNVDGNYDPGNCRWATHAEQARNNTRNVLVEYQGKRVPFCDLERSSSVSQQLALRRYRLGWPLERALTRAPRLYRRKRNGRAEAEDQGGAAGRNQSSEVAADAGRGLDQDPALARDGV